MNARVRVTAVDGGQAAGRDIHNHHTTLVQRETREWQLQAEFAQRTGIWCPKPAREWLEHLLQHHGFTIKELARAWKNNSIGWSAQRNACRINAPRLEGVFVLLLTLLCLYGVLEALVRYWLISAPRGPWDGIAALLQMTAMFTLFIFMVGPLLQSRRTALAVRRACKQDRISTPTACNNGGENDAQNLPEVPAHE